MEKDDKNEILQAISLLSKKIDKEIGEVKKELKEIPIIKKQLEEIPIMKKQLEEIPIMKKQLEEIPIIKKELRKISQSIAVIEHDHGEKVQILFETFSMNQDHIKSNEKRIQNCERRIETYDEGFDYINRKIQNI